MSISADPSERTKQPNRARKRERGTPVHTISWPLRPRPGQQRVIEYRFRTGVQVYNALLGESLKRSRAVKADPEYAVALAMPKGTANRGCPVKAARQALFAAIEDRHGFTKAGIESFGKDLRQGHVADHLKVHEVQVLASQAYRAVADWHYQPKAATNPKGKGRPRFKSTKDTGHGLHSISGKDRHSAIQPYYVSGALDGLRWGDPRRRGGMVIPLAAPASGHGRRAREQQENWEHLTKVLDYGGLRYVRIVRSRRGTGWTYTAQFVVDGPPLQRHAVATGGIATVDFGPSMSAVAIRSSEHDSGHQSWQAGLVPIAPDAGVAEAELRRAQRKLDRQHRAGSPECFNRNGTHKHKRCTWQPSRQARATLVKVRNLHAKAAATRATLHGTYANHLLSLAADIRIEDVSYLAWAKIYPHSAKRHGVGAQVATIRTKAASAGSRFWEFATYSTALSQTCLCGEKARKSLSDREHHCERCGLREQRDILSAYLGMFVHEVLDASTGEIQHLLDLEAANAFHPNLDVGPLVFPRHDVAEDRGSGSSKRRGRRHPPTRRSVARINARRKAKSEMRQSRSVNKSGQVAPTAVPA